jgi:hypothetical protein
MRGDSPHRHGLTAARSKYFGQAARGWQPYSVINTVVLPGTAITIRKKCHGSGRRATTCPKMQRGLTPIATDLPSFTFNDGNDMTGSDTTYTIVYGGNSGIMISGFGAAGDDFSGDGDATICADWAAAAGWRRRCRLGG